MPDRKLNIENRAKMNSVVRQFFVDREYLEVETPRFVRSPDIEPTLSHLETSVTTLEGRKLDGAMITSPEYALKKLVSPEISKVFEIARVFRNGEPLDSLHSAEFTMLEWYRLGSSFKEGIEETKKFIEYVANSFEYELKPWRIVTVEELFREHCGIESLGEPSVELYQGALKAHDLDFDPSDTISDLFQRLFLNLVQKHIDSLPNPVIVAYYPRHEATLAKINDDGFAERFEIYISGVELCNAYGELTDAVEQRSRFEVELEERRKLGKREFPIDDELIAALEKIDQPMFGIALGLDRLIMVMTGAKSLDDVILFSTNNLF
jgi:elongation factor P--(R)-beta-lysine ligase